MALADLRGEALMFVIFGLAELSRGHGEEVLFCARCGDLRPHARRSARGWFTLFFVPVLPLTPLSFHAQCGACARPQAVGRERWWALDPRRAAKRRWGRLWVAVASLVAALFVVGFVGSWLSPGPDGPPVWWAPIPALLLLAGPPAAVGVGMLRSARRLGEQAAEGSDEVDPTVRTVEELRTKACPACRRRVPVEAEKCGECGRAFDPVAVRKEAARAREAIARLFERLRLQAEAEHQRRAAKVFSILGWILMATLLLSTVGVIVLYLAHRARRKASDLEARLAAMSKEPAGPKTEKP